MPPNMKNTLSSTFRGKKLNQKTVDAIICDRVCETK